MLTLTVTTDLSRKHKETHCDTFLSMHVEGFFLEPQWSFREFRFNGFTSVSPPPQVGIQNYSASSRCQSRPSQTRSDYGKLFVVLVIIGSVCMVIITSGFFYICWQRRLPATKTTVGERGKKQTSARDLIFKECTDIIQYIK